MGFKDIWNKVYRTLASVRTGIILLLIVVLLSALGTVILQRPTTEPEVIQRTYSPQTLAWLDRLALTDIYHAWYFVALLALVSTSIIFVSIDRWPNAWRFYSRPYRRTEAHFRASLPIKATIPVKSVEAGLSAAERGFRKLGLPIERITDNSEVSLYSEKHRFSVFAVYIVHASLLLIFLGGIVDAVTGYRGYLRLLQGQPGNVIELRSGTQLANKKTLPFQVRADAIGQENYPDGMPKRYWSQLTVLDKGSEVRKKQIEVNDPLTYRGVRLFQASMGESEQLNSIDLVAFNDRPENGKPVTVALGQTVPIDENYSVKMVRYVPDYYVQDGEIFTKSEWPENPAFELSLIDKAGVEKTMWLIPMRVNVTMESGAPYNFSARKLNMAKFTGLEVAYQPGQWAVWAGVVLMAFGLGVVFYMAHTRYWATVVTAENGLVLWVGGASNRNRDRFEQRFKELVEAIRAEAGDPGTPEQTESAEKREVAHV